MKLTTKLIKKEKFTKSKFIKLDQLSNHSELREDEISFLPGTAPDIKLCVNLTVEDLFRFY